MASGIVLVNRPNIGMGYGHSSNEKTSGVSGPLKRNKEMGRVEKRNGLCLSKPCALSNEAGTQIK